MLLLIPLALIAAFTMHLVLLHERDVTDDAVSTSRISSQVFEEYKRALVARQPETSGFIDVSGELFFVPTVMMNSYAHVEPGSIHYVSWPMTSGEDQAAADPLTSRFRRAVSSMRSQGSLPGTVSYGVMTNPGQGGAPAFGSELPFSVPGGIPSGTPFILVSVEISS